MAEKNVRSPCPIPAPEPNEGRDDSLASAPSQARRQSALSPQYRLGPYIVDFVCLSARLIVEVDGASHDLTYEDDQRRTEWLKEQGFRVIRFWNQDVTGNLEGVTRTIEVEPSKTP